MSPPFQFTRLEDDLQRMRRAGPYEYLREYRFTLYSPDHYKALFA